MQETNVNRCRFTTILKFFCILRWSMFLSPTQSFLHPPSALSIAKHRNAATGCNYGFGQDAAQGLWLLYNSRHYSRTLRSTATPEDIRISDSQQQSNPRIDFDSDECDVAAIGELQPTTGRSALDSRTLSITTNNNRWRRKGKKSSAVITAAATAKTLTNKGDNRLRTRQLPRKAVQIYADYASRLWTDTSYEARQKIARDRASTAVRNVESVIRCGGFSDVSEHTKNELLAACQTAIAELKAARSCSDDGYDTLKDNNNNDDGLLGVQHLQAPLNVTEATSSIATVPGDSTMSPLTTMTTLPSFSTTSSSLQQQDQSYQVSLPAQQPTIPSDGTPLAAPAKRRRSVLFGAMMGAVVACWVFSGNYIFTGIFTLMTIIGQLEYYRAVISTGVYPARRITILGACSMFLSALFAPELHQICLPLFGLWSMIWFLTMRRQVSTIPEIATTFTGMFYLGYVPSFWVRIRLISAGREPTRLAPLVGPFLKFINKEAERNLPAFIPNSVYLPITTGAIFIFWTWLCLAFSDVAAYFVGRKFGRTKLGKIAPAAGATSPNKSVEGVLGGCAVSAILGMLGAWIQKWPYWWFTGSAHGMLLGLIGLIGDLTASMLKRDAGLKDFGDLIPDHGGILDRVDSFIWTAPYSWLVCAYVIPALKQFSRTGSLLPI